ncbi:hypothetical protein A2188_01020 [Candidatus Woesebacteria bacterium RIFOXYA1_FULL_43_9]|uniref:OBG-type G domain-containing protein n=1 Tax=Candidatus Woesebacteria bacterium RIFOXYA1_FULL_43_9 TaxID=1802534 RepID=A0A1F8CJ38_9BACT|nr:MAG: hypothetical protein A2188_01020 [Candidatus Woesebacteria bacterium RIFOXYA1_FULL_43_9]
MGLSVGIVGLPNVGKSTLFNALLKQQQAYVANFPFATIEPNVGIVPVPDQRLEKLAEIYKAPIVPATVKFVDIAGLIAGASKGEGLGNKFLAQIREMDVICHVVRVFTDKDIIRVGPPPSPEATEGQAKDDFETVKTELGLADLEHPDAPPFAQKPILVVLNIDENDLREANKLELKFAEELGLHASQVIAISAKVESELSALSETDQKNYLEDLGVKESGLKRLVTRAFATLGLMTFLTAGEKEVRAWTIKNNARAQDAAGEIHTDFVKKFIKADVCNFADFISSGGWKGAREAGLVRSESRDYIMKEGDIANFKIGC